MCEDRDDDVDDVVDYDDDDDDDVVDYDDDDNIDDFEGSSSSSSFYLSIIYPSTHRSTGLPSENGLVGVMRCFLPTARLCYGTTSHLWLVISMQQPIRR